MRLAIVLCVFAFLAVGDGMKVLVGVPGTIKSLSGLLGEISNVLAEAGHDVLLVTSHPPKKRSENLSFLHTEQFDELWNKMNVFHMRDPVNMTKHFLHFSDFYIPRLWTDQRMWDLWKQRHTFDVVIAMSYISEGMLPFLMDFNGQFVQIITPGIEFTSLSRNGNWLTPAVVPSILLSFDDQMSFLERALNLPGVAYTYYVLNNINSHMLKNLEEFFPNFPRHSCSYERADLSLINGHFSLDGPVPLLPNEVEIGTINSHAAGTLPKDLEDFISGAGEHGVIYFSLGSIAKTAHIPSYAKEAFAEAFSRIPQRVVWKLDDRNIKLPPNVLTRSWMPQQDILGHPKTRVFISHCGNQGTQEAKFHGVPVLAIPIAFDQPRNAARMERKGLAIVVTWEQLTADSIVEALNKLVNDTSYKERLTQISRITQDQKESPAERAVWWIEYIVRHKGAPQLQYAGKNMYLFQYIMLDVILFWTLLITVFVYTLVKGIKMLCCRSPRNVPTKKKKA